MFLSFKLSYFYIINPCFFVPNLEFKFHQKLRICIKRIELCWSIITRKEEVAAEESRHFQGELLKPHRLKEEGPQFSVLLVYFIDRIKRGERGIVEKCNLLNNYSAYKSVF